MRSAILAPAALAATLALAADAGPSTPGALQVTKPGGSTVDMPLRHTKVSIDVSAFVARATVEQVFENPFDAPVEAVYTFPLGDRAAVDDFELTVGDRTIRGEIKRREEARAVYEQARAAGYQAALLEQDRPNVFTQSVANLEPGKPITVRLRTVETLRYERGTYRLTFPLVVGPKYVPGGMAVQDAARINPPVLRPGMRSGHDVSIEVSLDAGVPISNLRSPSHKIVSEARSISRALVRLADGDAIPNKDFLLRWTVSSERPAVGYLAHRDGLDGFFTLLVQPKGEVNAAEAMPKEIVFVLDTSGSMSGIPIEASKRLVSKALHEMGPRDTFNLIRFAGDNEAYSKTFLPNDSASIEGALRWIERQQGGGGTEMLAALKAAFVAPADPNRVRIVVFLTDGYVGNDGEILSEIGKVLGDARIYTIGIGSSVHHYLLDRMADLGRGAYEFVRPDESADDALEAFRSWVTKPYLTDLSIDWGALPVADFGSERLRDLGSGQTLTLVGRYLDAGEGDVVVRGRLGGRAWEQRMHVKLPDRETRHEALGALWARGRIEGLMLGAAQGPSEAVRAEVTALALEYRLMSPYTSFVAVDDSTVVNPAGTSPTIHQAVPMPEGVSFEGIFGKQGPVPAAPAPTAQEEVRSERPRADSPAGAATKYSSEFIQDLPVAGRFYQNVLAPPPPPPPRPASSGARDRQFMTKVSGLSGDAELGAYASKVATRRARFASPRLDEGFMHADAHLVDAAFRVLADLADDGKISPAEGKPALAALLASQRTDGSMAQNLGVHAVATWALAEAALALPSEPFITKARAQALRFLVAAAKAGVSDAESALWARLVLRGLDPAAASSIVPPGGVASEAYESLRNALVASRTGSAEKPRPARTPFDRLLVTIGRRNLKVVRG
jgi:Ca-activated chloride channel homolog